MNDEPNIFQKARESAGLSILDLAHMFHCQTSQIYNIETGARGAGVSMRRRYVEHNLMTAEQALQSGEAA